MLDLEYLCEIHEKYNDAFKAKVEEFSIGNKNFNFNSQSAILGVVNLSSDSWYRESVCLSAEQAIRRGVMLKAQGADFIDIGAESSLPNAERVEDVRQKSKILPVLEALNQEGVLTSIETYYPAVAQECLRVGANIINLTGSQDNEEIYQLVSEFDAAVIICYVQGKNVREVGEFNFGEDPTNLMYDYFANEIEIATKLGVRKIFVDAGLGFYYKNLQDSSLRIRYQMKTFLNTFRLRKLGFPVCHALPHAFECFGEEVRSAEPFFAVLAALGKTDLFRTHEVSKIKGVLDTLSLF
ncbi:MULTISPECIES: dihydropteroate synthase [Cyanophyceae]|uniref:Dihydropteroate synthase n=1 Tax=Nodularia spumigena CENA596 TaxID=1819295 RepID=A0A166ITN8_NODSP|nr:MULTISPECIES: dihydropteroate synthase [Cyanophyceae]MDB9357008.1 dihydropteroate synthase [Nodularia spumigena CS-587/03]KZL48831.1 dihydropteroate synthase [Nodularia spumigena CENA596]MDB9305978.1 dihydropteroate synthase [Nodularia spumigena CS-591/12]MDB9321084.1 dihydropteroate synthase [Nodularia spumigena CS-591/07A]MDB9330639.1 dihydropteroate synthase [Nodularia spumigena CS-591/04]